MTKIRVLHGTVFYTEAKNNNVVFLKASGLGLYKSSLELETFNK